MLRLRAAIVFTILATLVAVMSAQLRHPATGIDDADIFLVYGRNLAQGYGLVYNPGGERVEGFTSPLWMLANAIAFRVASQPESLLLLTNVVLVSIGVALLWAHVDRGRRVTVAGVAVVLWTLSSPSFVGWTTLTLMDAGPWSFALCLGAVVALSGRSAWRLAVVVPLLVLARPEGVVWAPIFIVLFLLLSTRHDAPTTPWRAVGISLFTYFCTVAGITAWRMIYFGYPLPNTFYAKVSPSFAYNLVEGAKYLIAFLYANPVMIVAVVPAISAFLFIALRVPASRSPQKTPVLSLPLAYLLATSAIVITSLLIPVVTGGDHFGNFRFYQPPWPLMLLPCIAATRAYPLRPSFRLSLLTTVLLFLAAASSARASWLNGEYLTTFGHELELARMGREIGTLLNRIFPNNLPTVGVIRAGGIRLTYKGQILDLAGLNNTAFGHAPGNRQGIKNHAAFNLDVFFLHAPQLLLPTAEQSQILCATWPELFSWNNTVLKGLLTDPRFVHDYTFARISNGGQTIHAYAQRHFLDQLTGEGYAIKDLSTSASTILDCPGAKSSFQNAFPLQGPVPLEAPLLAGSLSERRLGLHLPRR